MHAADISAVLKKNGKSQADIARICGVSRGTVNQIILSRNRSERLEKAISEATSLPLHVLWPQWHPAPEGAEPAQPFGAAADASAKVSGVEIMLIKWFRDMDAARQMVVLNFVAELGSKTRSKPLPASELNAAAQFAKAIADLEAQSSTAHFAKMQAAKDAQDRAEYVALLNQPVLPSIKIKNKDQGKQTNNFFKKS